MPTRVDSMINPSLWSQFKDDTGFIDMEPYRAKLKTNKPVYIKQYPLSKDKEVGITPLIENFVQQGVLEPTHSPYNTPINPVVKADGKTWRLTQDLRAVNQLIIPLAPIVPDVLTVMNSVPYSHKYFTVIDLCAAFFSVPVHPDTQPLLAFTFKGQQYSWKRLAQGYADSPAVFSAAVHRTLAKMTDLPSSVCVLQFADDILVSGETAEDCEKASVIVCNVLAETGFKASKDKLQWVKTKVTYLGHVLMQGLRAISTDRVQLIRKVKSPRTVQQLQSFLGLINYCRQWIPDCGIHDRHLRGLIDHKAPPNTPLEWTAEADEHFNALKAAITTAPALGLPDYAKPFHLHVRETAGTALGVLLQEHGSTYRPVAYLSKKLDNIVTGMPACLRAVAAAALIVQMAEKTVLSHPLTLYTSHQVGAILHNMQTQHMTAQRRSGYEATLLATKNLTIKPTASINPALLSILGMVDMADFNVEHDCIFELTNSYCSRVDLLDTPLEGGEHIYVDGSCSKPSDGVYLCGYAVVSNSGEVKEAYALDYNSAQAAELVALIRACRLMSGKKVTVYTDSKYAWSVLHHYAKMWEVRNFTTSDGRPIAHANLIGQLTEAVQLPLEVAIVKVKGHSSGDDELAVGNRRADEAAKAAAQAQIKSPFQQKDETQVAMTVHIANIPDIDIKILQSQPTKGDLEDWSKNVCAPDTDGILRDEQGRIALPKLGLIILIRHYHGLSHTSCAKVVQAINRLYCIADVHKTAKLVLDACLTCAQVNPHKSTKHDALTHPEAPFQHLQIDFTHMPPIGNLKYLLVIVDRFSKWPEAFPCAREDAKTVVKILTKEIVPRYGIPATLESDNTTSFTSKVTQLLAKALSIDWHFNIPYHPQSAGVMERSNRTLKTRLTKAVLETGRKWVDLLPAVLTEIRMTPSSTTKLSPFEILMGRPFPTPWVKGRSGLSSLGDLEVIQEDYVICADVSLCLPLPSEQPTHNFVPGQKVFVRSLKPTKVGESKYHGPATVIAVTRTGVLTDYQPQWIHASRLKLCLQESRQAPI
ncbi:Retrovirus-related Pol polyprotein from transposon opus [Triplophysa tibetana]|uniref:ribonuclease H n=1 Tax=Triplophysa tibetana TaxID=1572043 RepID=A0A5A9PP97_9TELE|nr:Retrovirus-related Pol polyprotein from transposon opus [Triplophysa tibetana]